MIFFPILGGGEGGGRAPGAPPPLGSAPAMYLRNLHTLKIVEIAKVYLPVA